MPQLGGLDSCVAPSIILAQRVKEPLHLPFDFRCIGVHAALLPVWLRAEGLITYFGKTGKLFPAHSYGNRRPLLLDPAVPSFRQPHTARPDFDTAEWMFEVVFDYGDEHYQQEPPDEEGRIFARVSAAQPTALAGRPARTHFPVTAPGSRSAPTGCAGGCSCFIIFPTNWRPPSTSSGPPNSSTGKNRSAPSSRASPNPATAYSPTAAISRSLCRRSN